MRAAEISLTLSTPSVKLRTNVTTPAVTPPAGPIPISTHAGSCAEDGLAEVAVTAQAAASETVGASRRSTSAISSGTV